MKNEKINDEIENKYDEIYENKNDEIDDYKFKTFIYFNFKKTKISKINNKISKKNDKKLIILPNVKSPVVKASKEALIKFKKQRFQFLFIFNVNDDEVMINITYLMNVVMKYEKYFVHENVMMFIYKKNNALNFESFYLKMMIKDKKHVDGFDYACHLMKIFANVN